MASIDLRNVSRCQVAEKGIIFLFCAAFRSGVYPLKAKTEEDAVSEAIDVAERRIRMTLGKEFDIELWSEAYSHGDESPQDDEADVEVHYDESFTESHNDGPEDKLHYINER